MNASHRSLKEDFEVSCRELDILAETAQMLPGVLGSRMMGGGFGGCTISLVRRDDLDAFKETLRRVYLEKTGITCTFIRSVRAEGRKNLGEGQKMAIRYDGDQGIFFLDTDRTTYQMKTGRYGHLLHLYYGRTAKEAMDGNIILKDRGFSGNPYEAGLDRTYSLDAVPQEYPTQGTGDYRSPLLSVTDERGVYGCDLRVDSHRIIPGKYSLPELPAAFASAEADEAQTLEIRLVCGDPSLEVTLYYGVLPHADVITRSAVIRNAGTTRVTLEKAQTACLDFTEGEFDRIIFYGRHTMERVPDRQAVGHGATVIGSRRGFSSHQYNPMMILCEQQTDEESGRCWSMQFVYSGGFKAEIEKDQYDQTRMQMGLMEEQFSWPLAPGEEFVLPEVLMSFSGETVWTAFPESSRVSAPPYLPLALFQRKDRGVPPAGPPQ